MDISETYIELCKKAEEIQKTHEWADGDYSSNGSVPVYLSWQYSELGWGYPSSEEIWLPKQDQLQMMVGGWPSRGFIDWQEWLSNVYGFNYGDKPNGHLHIFTSGEQLWLALVMKEKFNKIWKDGQWSEDM